MTTRSFTILSCCALVALSIAGFASAGGEKKDARPAAGYSGTIKIKTPGGKTATQPTVVFSHEKHSSAVTSAGQDCSACHTPAKGERGTTISYALKNTRDKLGKDAKQAFHDACVGCHVEYAGKRKKSCYKDNGEKLKSHNPTLDACFNIVNSS